MISVSNVSMRYGAKVLFEDVSVTFTPGKRFGLTGPNGSGKSTFMKVLTGELDAQKGSVVRPKKFGEIRQDQFAFDARRVVDTVIMGNKPLWAAMEEREIIYAKPYNASAKMVENAFKRLDTYLFSALPGYAGGERMRAKTSLRVKLPASRKPSNTRRRSATRIGKRW